MKAICVLFVIVLGVCTARAESNTLVVGWLERVLIEPASIVMHAKIDTGADNCSIHAENISFTRKGTKSLYAEFDVQNRYGESRKIRRRVVRTAKIKTKNGGVQKRPVVSVGICLDTIFEYVECNLVDRSHFEYPVLLGRNFLASQVLVDSSETYLSEPHCEIRK